MASLRVSVSLPRDRRAPYAWVVRGVLSAPACQAAKVTLKLGTGRAISVKTDKKCAFRATVRGSKRKGRFMLVVSAGGVTKRVALRAG